MCTCSNKAKPEKFYARIFARVYNPFMQRMEARILRPKREQLLSQLKGNILEVEDAITVGYFFDQSWFGEIKDQNNKPKRDNDCKIIRLTTLDINRVPSYRKDENNNIVQFMSTLKNCRILNLSSRKKKPKRVVIL